MTFDLIVRNAALPDGRTGLDIAVSDGAHRGGRAEASRAEAGRDARGRRATSSRPPFVDVHFHMDATLSLGLPRLNESGTLLEGIALWGELKPLLTHEAVIERALRYCDLAVAQGLLAIRSHVDVCDDRLLAVDALLEVKRRVAPYLDLQLVAFPQDGYYRSPGAAENLERALEQGIEVVGGIPHFERTMADGAASVRALCEIAAERGLRVDMHCDETDDPLSRHIETLAFETQRLGLQGRVAGSHLTSMHSMDNYYVSKLLPLMAEAGRGGDREPAHQHPDPGPARHLSEAARHDPDPGDAPARHPVRLRPRLRDGPLVLPRAGRHARGRSHGDPRRPHDEPRGDALCLDAVTMNPARIMGLDGYGLDVGCNADFVILQARDPIEAIRLKAARLAVVRRGRLVAESGRRLTKVYLPGRPGAVDPSTYVPSCPFDTAAH